MLYWNPVAIGLLDCITFQSHQKNCFFGYSWHFQNATSKTNSYYSICRNINVTIFSTYVIKQTHFHMANLNDPKYTGGEILMLTACIQISIYPNWSNMDEICYLLLTIPYSHQGYTSENPEADNAVQVFRMPEPNVHSQVLPSTSEVALYFDF